MNVDIIAEDNLIRFERHETVDGQSLVCVMRFEPEDTLASVYARLKQRSDSALEYYLQNHIPTGA